MISVVVSYIYFAIYKWGPNSLTSVSLYKYDKATIASNFISFFAQLIQIWILSQFSEHKEETEEEKRLSQTGSLVRVVSIQVEEYDEGSDVQARIWNMFVRRGVKNEHIMKHVGEDEDFRNAMLVTSALVR